MTRAESNLLNAIEKFVKQRADENEINAMTNILLDLASMIEKAHEKNESLESKVKYLDGTVKRYEARQEVIRLAIIKLLDMEV